MVAAIPSFYISKKVKEIYPVPYRLREMQAILWREKYNLQPASEDKKRICLLLIDNQNTFCLPGFELFVGGITGRGAIDDSDRLCRFIYHNMDVITEIIPTLDTHYAIQIFHSIFWINDAGKMPAPYTIISADDVRKGVWKVNPAIANILDDECKGVDIQEYALHYVETLEADGKYMLIIWPYHGMLGSIGQAQVSAIHEALFFHSIARNSRIGYEIKGQNMLTEKYSVLKHEVNTLPDGRIFTKKNLALIKKLLGYDMVIIAGEAKSHCVASTIRDLSDEIKMINNPALAKKIYLLTDCTSSVYMPGGIDFPTMADQMYLEFEKEGMHLVESTDEIKSWPESPIGWLN